MAGLAIIAGSGGLPPRLSALYPGALCISFAGVPHDLGKTLEHRFETLGSLFEDMHARGVTEVVLAGAMARPPLDPSKLDPLMLSLAPRIMAVLQGGDDALLSLVISIFEEQGLTVRGAHELDPDLTTPAGLLSGKPLTDQQSADAVKAAKTLHMLSPLDVAQGAVFEQGLCLGIETLQGTDALLGFVAATPAHLRRKTGGTFVKAPKTGQDLRVDMPTIGPATITAAHDAGLTAVVIAANKVMILERDETLGRAKTLGVSLIAQDL
jgi:DUF1009 family protein